MSTHAVDESSVSSKNAVFREHRRSGAIERFSQSHLPRYHPSRASSTERSTAETSAVHTSAHNISHNLSSVDESRYGYTGRKRIPGTTWNEGDPDAVSARLEQMRKQVLSKEFWMADEICKECFHCGDTFTAFRRKHHCRTCGCIFDSKCTSIISGDRFGVQGTIRVCKTCLDIINRRHDSSDDDSGDDTVLPTTFFQSHQMKDNSSKAASSIHEPNGENVDSAARSFMGEPTSPIATPMMAIPATRRIGDSANRKSAILEIDAPQLSRPSSSRSLKALSSSRPSTSNLLKAIQPKSNFLQRFRSSRDERPPFHHNVAADQAEKRSRLPAFHDDNIIDPDLAPYMSDDESSGDEQMSIFTAMNGSGNVSTSFDNEKTAFGSLMAAGRKHRSRGGEKSISGVSFAGRAAPDDGTPGSYVPHTRPNRRRNMSTSSVNILMRGSPKQNKTGGLLGGFGELSEETPAHDSPLDSSSSGKSKMTRSASMRDANAPAIELNSASLRHVRKLLRQLLQDANIPHVNSWEKALIPILLQCTDDVNPDVRSGDDMDIRHYVKLKKIPGGRPGDTSYVSGVVFTKNLALKSMPRSISQPRIVIITFPIEYQRHQQHFMSLEPVIAQERDFLRNMVNRIASLRPQVVFVQSHISGLALQYLNEAHIAVAYNVKQSVIEAVSRFAQTEIISSIDMVALKPVHVGKCARFDVKTYVHRDIPGKKKTCIYISGCPKELGCTIVLRGASMPILTRMKRITEFMVYVVYNLKLETCLMRDEFVLIPSSADDDEKSAGQQSNTSSQVLDHRTADMKEKIEPEVKVPEALDAGAGAGDTGAPSFPQHSAATTEADGGATEPLPDPARPNPLPKLVSAHDSHARASANSGVPEDIPMPTFYSDMVAKHQTKILSASPFVKFTQPYLLMNAREQERRLVYLKRLRDQDTFEEQSGGETQKPQRFQLIQPEMVHETVKGAPKQIMEVLHAVHDAEYDKALHNYQTQKRQWENHIQGNLNLFDPYSHQNIVVLYTLVCTETTVPCAGPDLTAISFYNEYESLQDFFPDCTLGQYVEDLCLNADAVCASNGCERRMTEHHHTYVHGEARITVFVEKSPCKLNGLQDSILMWSYCKICKKETQVMPMSQSTWKYSFGKYLELSFWSSGLEFRAGFCPHDLHRDHLRYIGYMNTAMRIHYDPIDLLEIVVPRTRITWKVDNDLKLKNELFTKTEDRWNRFMTSVKSRIQGINIDSVAAEKAEACKEEIDNLSKRAQDEHAALLRKLQDKYMESKYYEIIPMNRAIRAMQEKVAEWDAAFAEFDANYFPSEKDIRRLAALQLRNLFLDRDASTSSLVSHDASEQASDVDEKNPDEISKSFESSTNISPTDMRDSLESVAEEDGVQEVPPTDSQPSIDSSHEQSGSAAVDAGSTHGIPEAPAMGDHLRLEARTVIPKSGSPATEDVGAEQSGDAPTQADINGEVATAPQSDAKVDAENDVAVPESACPGENELEEPLPIGSEGTLPARLQQIRKLSKVEMQRTGSDASGIPRPTERSAARSTAMASTQASRNQTQLGVLRRLNTAPSRSSMPTFSGSSFDEGNSALSAANDPLKDRRLSERLGIGSLKSSRKPGQSFIPRSVQGARRDSKVSTLAKHFEELSREFEKERMRDRKQRAAKVTQSRAFPKASSKPIVEVYKDVNEAVGERNPSDEELRGVEVPQTLAEETNVIESLTKPVFDGADSGHSSPPLEGNPLKAYEDTPPIEKQDDQDAQSQAASDDEGASDGEQSILGDMPGLTESIGISVAGCEVELPKHEKSSLMRMLTNFWAERSASGWTQLEYPFHSSDHVFVDSDVIVREDEPSSLIAFALSSQDYIEKLEAIRQQGEPVLRDHGLGDSSEADVETSLLRATGTHLKYQFAEGSAKMMCKIFYAEQFDAVRRKCGVADRIVESLSRCLKWDSKGGKTKSVFLKTLDERLVLKSLSPIETQAFLSFAPAYFNIMAEALFHDLPTVIAKMLGFYQIIIKNPVTGTEIKWDVLVMENLFYDRVPTRIFDLKGSMRNRKIQSTGEQNEVLLDENMVEFIYESPLFAREHSKKLLKASVWNDTLFLARQNVMDYSLMVAVDEARKELVVGIIDCIRTYTWDKKLESWIKDRGFAGGGRNRPTVTSPKEYKSRFREAMDRYVLQAPK